MLRTSWSGAIRSPSKYNAGSVEHMQSLQSGSTSASVVHRRNKVEIVPDELECYANLLQKSVVMQFGVG